MVFQSSCIARKNKRNDVDYKLTSRQCIQLPCVRLVIMILTCCNLYSTCTRHDCNTKNRTPKIDTCNSSKYILHSQGGRNQVFTRWAKPSLHKVGETKSSQGGRNQVFTRWAKSSLHKVGETKSSQGGRNQVMILH